MVLNPGSSSGDWNDGMDAVGEGGKGESVWLGWFLYSALNAFANLAEQRDNTVARGGVAEASRGSEGIAHREAWDGDWYRRAFFDDGSPLGSVANNDCRIDFIAQSWAVISGAADPARSMRAMAAVDKYLVRRDDKLLLLFTPPFDNPTHYQAISRAILPDPRERRPIYTRRGLGCAGVHHAGRWRQGGRAVVDA